MLRDDRQRPLLEPVEVAFGDVELRQIFARRYSAIIPPKESLEHIVLEEKRKFDNERLFALAESEKNMEK